MTAQELTTKTIAGVTYYQDPEIADLWYDDPTKVGRHGVARDTAELGEIRRRATTLRRWISKRTAEDDDGRVSEWQQELEDCDADIEILAALKA